MNEIKPGTIDEYIGNFPEKVRKLLEQMRATVREAAPDAVEKISYQMPAFALNGILVYFGAFKNHIGFFPTASGVEAFSKELSAYAVSKGTVRFPLDKPLPLELINKIVRFKVKENMEKGTGKKALRKKEK